jgi:hypothetical protein
VLTEVDVTNVRSDTLQLPLLSAAGGFAVRDIQGLDPVNAAVTTSSMAQLDGAQYQNARRDMRNITMKLGLTPNFVDTTVDSLRQTLYDYFMPKSNIGLTFWKDGSVYAVCSGMVEDFQNTMFSADPEVDISIICFDPDFYAPSVTNTSFTTVSTTDTTTFNYPGSSDAGLIFTLNVNRALLSSFTVFNTTPDNVLTSFEMTGAFVSGDVITINSIPGQKSATLTRAGITTSALSMVDPTNSGWPVFQRGVNLFRAFASGAAVPCSVAYTTKYGGL